MVLILQYLMEQVSVINHFYLSIAKPVKIQSKFVSNGCKKMRWFKKENENRFASYQTDFISPVELAVNFDQNTCQQTINKLLAYGTDCWVDVDLLLELLNEKQHLFQHLLQKSEIDDLQPHHLKQLMHSHQVVSLLGNDADWPELKSQIAMLLHGSAELSERMHHFMVCVGGLSGIRNDTVIWNFMAELLHFFHPENYPLMSRWIWHEQTQRGVMREFVAQQNDDCRCKIGGQSVDFEAHRVWFAQQLGKKGLFQNVHFYIDLIFAQAYADYILSITPKTQGKEVLTNDSYVSLSIIANLLGIDIKQHGSTAVVYNATVH